MVIKFLCPAPIPESVSSCKLPAVTLMIGMVANSCNFSRCSYTQGGSDCVSLKIAMSAFGTPKSSLLLINSKALDWTPAPKLRYVKSYANFRSYPIASCDILSK